MTSKTREEWLNSAVNLMAPMFTREARRWESTYYMFSSAEDEFRDLQQHYVLWADDGEDE